MSNILLIVTALVVPAIPNLFGMIAAYSFKEKKGYMARGLVLAIESAIFMTAVMLTGESNLWITFVSTACVFTSLVGAFTAGTCGVEDDTIKLKDALILNMTVLIVGILLSIIKIALILYCF